MRVSGFAAAAALTILATGRVAAQPAEAAFLERFRGTWEGGGTVRRSIDPGPWTVRCTLNGVPGPNAISIQGTCTGALIVQRQIGAELTFDPRARVYRGVYVGARVGPAALAGTRGGDVVSLVITWPAPVAGDTRAAMTIHNRGDGTLRIVTEDNLVPGGPIQQTANLVLQRR
ncbi:MAG TPA: hypothetical protein VHN20_07525 [Beijerinckiaceae bacterium]|nr:hypothetical protein [Beijerinckiaceae bacterium]